MKRLKAGSGSYIWPELIRVRVLLIGELGVVLLDPFWNENPHMPRPPESRKLSRAFIPGVGSSKGGRTPAISSKNGNNRLKSDEQQRCSN
jgi:hypothetical protein